MYNLVKRFFDIIISGVAIIILSPLMIVLSILVKYKLGSPPIFKQKRPGKDMKIYEYHKFKTMNDDTDEKGNLLPDDVRLTPFGAKLRSTSLDELPQLFDIFMGKMSLIGPRPQTIENIMFMSNEQKRRQSVIPGLTGLAQINGRNNTTWDERVMYDLEYIDNQSFLLDLKIFFITIQKVFKQADINQDATDNESATSATFETMGDYLLRTNQITKEEYFNKKYQISRELYVNKRNIPRYWVCAVFESDVKACN
jgi:lipopolysaccharide/colanic/teichoic acid biosynthesis glycosyltransferase